jgi:hypothetical protein
VLIKSFNYYIKRIGNEFGWNKNFLSYARQSYVASTKDLVRILHLSLKLRGKPRQTIMVYFKGFEDDIKKRDIGPKMKQNGLLR